jgi:uncharacterized protein (TIGR02246 family)
VSAPVSPSNNATALLAAAGIVEDPSYYGQFTDAAQKTVLTIPMRIQAAWQSNDADAFADVFASNGSLLMKNDQLTSREQIRTYMAGGFQSFYKGASVNGWPLAITFLGDDVAIVITEGGIIMAGETESAPERRIRATWVIVSQDGVWRLMSHQSSPIVS